MAGDSARAAALALGVRGPRRCEREGERERGREGERERERERETSESHAASNVKSHAGEKLRLRRVPLPRTGS